MKQQTRLQAILIAGALAIVASAGPARAAEESRAAEGGFGTLSAITSILYAPVKMAYATGGLVFGGIAWALSGGDGAVANAVITPAVRGDYVVTPAVLRGERPLEFIGKDPEYRAQVAEQTYY